MAPHQKSAASAMEIDRLATQLAKDPQSKAFLPLAEEYCKVGMWEEAVAVLEDGLKYYPGFITAMVALGRAYDQLNQVTKAKAVLEAAVKLSPDNLRAHRTLIKIYKTQGLAEEARKSCRVILAMNPRDEEALSIQASLGALAKPEPAKPAPIQETTPVAYSSTASVPATELMVPIQQEFKTTVEKHAYDVEGSGAAATDLPIDTARDLLMETAPRPEPSSSSQESSPHAETIAQLESWLRSIERRRRDRTTSGDSIF